MGIDSSSTTPDERSVTEHRDHRIEQPASQPDTKPENVERRQAETRTRADYRRDMRAEPATRPREEAPDASEKPSQERTTDTRDRVDARPDREPESGEARERPEPAAKDVRSEQSSSSPPDAKTPAENVRTGDRRAEPRTTHDSPAGEDIRQDNQYHAAQRTENPERETQHHERADRQEPGDTRTDQSGTDEIRKDPEGQQPDETADGPRDFDDSRQAQEQELDAPQERDGDSSGARDSYVESEENRLSGEDQRHVTEPEKARADASDESTAAPEQPDESQVQERTDELTAADELATPEPDTGTWGQDSDADSAERRDEELADSPPSAEDLDRWRELYLEDRKSRPAGWEQGVNVVGDRPDRSPGDTSDLPPTGDELVHMEPEDVSRLEKLARKTFEDFDDITDIAAKASNRAEQLLPRPPGGQAEAPVPSHPYFSPTAPQHAGVDAGSIADLTLVLGVIGFKTGQVVRHKVTEWKTR